MSETPYMEVMLECNRLNAMLNSERRVVDELQRRLEAKSSPLETALASIANAGWTVCNIFQEDASWRVNINRGRGLITSGKAPLLTDAIALAMAPPAPWPKIEKPPAQPKVNLIAMLGLGAAINRRF